MHVILLIYKQSPLHMIVWLKKNHHEKKFLGGDLLLHWKILTIRKNFVQRSGLPFLQSSVSKKEAN